MDFTGLEDSFVTKRILREKYPQVSDIGIELLLSSLTVRNPFIPTESVPEWIENLNRRITWKIEVISLSDLKNWFFDEGRNLRHKSGKYFSIEGIKVKIIDNKNKTKEWSQPIINQPEVGILGIITQKFNGVLYFLLQAKIEPGNVNKVQLSPTVQATRSNFMLIHGGTRPLYIDYFLNIKKHRVIVDQLQSEQGARFYKKRNRNIIIEVDDKEQIELFDNFIWLTLGQIKLLLNIPNIINMDTRTILSCTQIL
jgi:dTDP-4-dehydro-6-deoxy-alpha-D-glucopyranose 2,3-dehydratase